MIHTFDNVEGKTIPDVYWNMRINNKWTKVHSNDIFKNKRVVVFSLPGAFTPTCSSSHLPRYEELADTIKKAAKVDDIVCISVNDTFVMNEWAKDQDIKNVTLIPDGNGEFTEKLGFLVDKSDLTFGKRSWRYSMFVDNCVIKKTFVEPDKEGDPFEVSDADTMLDYLAPNTKRPLAITIFTRIGCPFCAKAKELLKSKGLLFEEINVARHGITSKTLRAVASASTVPQVFIDGKLIGGSEALEKYLSSM